MTAHAPRMLGLVCARGGSEGLPGKNLVPLAGLPLIVHTVNAYLAWGGADRLACSTDDADIAAIVADAGIDVPWLRPPELARSEVPKRDVLRHAVQQCEAEDHVTYDIVIDLDVCSPLRTVDDIEAVVAAVVARGATNAFSVTPSRRNPYFNMVEVDKSGWAQLAKRSSRPISGRQHAPAVFDMNASVYAYRRDFLLTNDGVIGARTAVHVMPPERSVDVDSALDLVVLTAVIAAGLAQLPKRPKSM